jgi:hypothetical protein
MKITEQMTLVAGILTIIKWVYEYSQKNNWEKNRFLLERIEKFREKESVKKVQTMLDWNKISIEFEEKWHTVSDEILYEALQTHDIKHSFSTLEFNIRKSFDEYFDGITDLILLEESGLVSGKNLKIFLQYWLNILNGNTKNKPVKLVQQFQKYLKYYGYTDLEAFLRKKSLREKLTEKFRKRF